MAFIGREHPAVERAERAVLGVAWEVRHRVREARHADTSSGPGLRMVCFHDTGRHELDQLRRIVEFWGARGGAFARPDDVDDLVAGAWPTTGSDRLLFTFDDGLDSNHRAAQVLADLGLSAVFFVVPSFLGRSTTEFLALHERNGVQAFAPPEYAFRRGMSHQQAREVVAMGHRLGAHNDAHRSLGALHRTEDVAYDIQRALDGVAELTGAPCHDYAYAFGQPEHLSDAAAAYLQERVPRVYACHRGLNRPGSGPAFLLRHAVDPTHPWPFIRACLTGAGDAHLRHRADELEQRVGTLTSRRSGGASLAA